MHSGAESKKISCTGKLGAIWIRAQYGDGIKKKKMCTIGVAYEIHGKNTLNFYNW